MTTGIEEVLGLKAGILVAGFVGAIASLAYMRDLTPAKAIFALVVGTGCAAYVTPLVMGWLNLSNAANGENAAAFIVGVVGMNLVGAFYRGGEQLRQRGIMLRPGPGLSVSDKDESEGDE
ncbi:MAG: peptidase M48 [Planctomycetota bacterium]|jgi:hypothetical protein